MSAVRLLSRRRLLQATGVGLVSSAVAACGATPTPEVVKETVVVEKVVEATAAPAEKVTIRFSSVGWGGWLSEPWQSIVQDFNESQDRITVPEYEDVAEGYQKVMAAAAGNVAADVYMFENKYMFGFATRGFFLPLEDYVATSASIKEEDFFANDWRECFFRGKQYLVPFDNSPAMIWYNPDLFDAAGVDYPPAKYGEWTVEDFLITAKGLTSGEGAEKVFGWAGERFPYLLNWIWGNGGWFLTEDKTRCVVDSPESVEALEWAASLITEHQVQPLPEQIPQGGTSGLFYAKRAAMAQRGTWWAIDLKAQEGLKWQTAPHPDGPAGSFVRNPNDAWGIWIGSPHRDAAWEFIEFLAADQSLEKLTKAGLSPSKKSVLYSDVFLKQEPVDVHWDLFVDALENHVRRHPDTAVYAPMQDLMRAEWDAIIAGSKTVKDSMTMVAEECNKLLDQCRAEGNCD